MPGKTSWHSEPPATWLFNFNGLHQMFQAKGPRRTRTDGLPAQPPICSPPWVPAQAVAVRGAGAGGPGLGARGGVRVHSHLPTVFTPSLPVPGPSLMGGRGNHTKSHRTPSYIHAQVSPLRSAAAPALGCMCWPALTDINMPCKSRLSMWAGSASSKASLLTLSYLLSNCPSQGEML